MLNCAERLWDWRSLKKLAVIHGKEKNCLNSCTSSFASRAPFYQEDKTTVDGIEIIKEAKKIMEQNISQAPKLGLDFRFGRVPYPDSSFEQKIMTSARFVLTFRFNKPATF